MSDGGKIDEQDPLPENNFMWRRIFTFATTLIVLAFVAYALESLHQLQAAEYVYYLGKYLIGLCALLVMFYMVAPSAEQIVKLIQAARLMRDGIVAPPPSRRPDCPPENPPSQGSSGRRPAMPPPRGRDDDDVAPRSRPARPPR